MGIYGYVEKRTMVLKYILVPYALCAFSYPLYTAVHLLYMRHIKYKTQKDQVRPLCKETYA